MFFSFQIIIIIKKSVVPFSCSFLNEVSGQKGIFHVAIFFSSENVKPTLNAAVAALFSTRCLCILFNFFFLFSHSPFPSKFFLFCTHKHTHSNVFPYVCPIHSIACLWGWIVGGEPFELRFTAPKFKQKRKRKRKKNLLNENKS